MTALDHHIAYMRQAFALARRGIGFTFPNPMVGAVIVQKGKVIGKGWHHRAGGPHAEIEALRSARTNVRGATMIVTLEPCCHYGKTPPCTDALISAGIARVVFAVRDPNPDVRGKGAQQLQRAGVRVTEGVLADEARRLNEHFFAFHEWQRPFVSIKFAASLDGAIATRTGDSKWITSEEARAYARSLRSQHHAVLVGKNTVIRDDPHLGARQRGAYDPIRVVLDSAFATPLSRKIFRDERAIVFTTKSASAKKREKLAARGIAVEVLPSVTIPRVLARLHSRNIVSVLVEGGGETIGSFVDAGVVDRVYAFHAPMVIGGQDARRAVQGSGVSRVSSALQLQNVEHRTYGTTLLTVGDVITKSPARSTTS